MKTNAHFTAADGMCIGKRDVRIHLTRLGVPFALVFGGVSYRATGVSSVWSGDPKHGAPPGTRMYQMCTPGEACVWVNADGAWVHLGMPV